MTDYTVSKRQINDDGITITELVFNYTDADYFALVPAEKVSEFHHPTITCVCEGHKWPLEVRTVRANYRNGPYYFTIVRFEMGFFYNRDNSFGRQIAINVGEYFGDILFRRSELYKKKLYSFDERREGIYRHIYGIDDKNDAFLFCFSPSIQSEGYYFKAFTGEFSQLDMGTECPFGNTVEDDSLVDYGQIKLLKSRIDEAQSKIIQLPTEFELSINLPYDEWQQQLSLSQEIEGMIKERRKIENRLKKLKVAQTIERYRADIETLDRKIEAHPLHGIYATLEENKRKNLAAEDENYRLKCEIWEIENQLRALQNKKFMRPRRAGREECWGCPFYAHSENIFSQKLICSISRKGLSLNEEQSD